MPIDIQSLPQGETSEFEYKSSLTPLQDLKAKISKGVSGLANAGGGWFVCGVDDKTGDPDGGFDQQFGRQPLRDWIDQAVHSVGPTPVYSVHFEDDPQGRGNIDAGKVVFAIEVPQSLLAPHMAPDGRYYIRAGVHTVPANHFIVEGIRALRVLNRPKIVPLFHTRQLGNHVNVDVELVEVNGAPALDVSARIIESGGDATDAAELGIALVDQQHPCIFRFGVPRTGNTQRRILMTYSDVLGNKFRDEAIFDAAGPLTMVAASDRTSLDDIAIELNRIADVVAPR